ncbi:proton channel OtopLc isoform X2 [Thrips palmi]|uniref:Proton channel OtopLc isoform X2 n=1 Tax=Thrips palmi TaxID=161013 RepID=A0A6P8Z7K9_THRPL|nr:proton channel OtopLc isoform X2 [Thrips palmi]
MQQCPYLQEMKERLVLQGADPEQLLLVTTKTIKTVKTMDKDVLEVHQDPAVGTVVKLNAGGYGQHTSPAHIPLISREPRAHDHTIPKNAKTSLFIILSFIYAKLLVVVCIAFVVSEVANNALPLFYYEGFFSYLYGASIFFLLYVFCFLLQESACCAGSPDAAERERLKRETAASRQREKDRQKAAKEKEKADKDKAKKDKKDDKGKGGKGDAGAPPAPPQPDAPAGAKQALYPQDAVEMEGGLDRPVGRKRKTSQNNSSHGSFFLRVGAIAFGLGTMIYTGLEFGTFFETPMSSTKCYNILRGLNPLLQMVFTFMQMYFIFMNSRLNIHRFKVIARFGLMHIVATNICVWIRTLMLESIKEISVYMALSDQGKQALLTTHATPLFYGNGKGLSGLGLGKSLSTTGKTGGTNYGQTGGGYGQTGGNYGQPGAGGIISGYGANDLVETFQPNPLRSANMVVSTVATAGSYAVKAAQTTMSTLASTAATTLRTLPTTLSTSTTTTSTTTTTLPPSSTTPFLTTLASTAASTLVSTTTSTTPQSVLRQTFATMMPDAPRMPFDHDAGIKMGGNDEMGGTLPVAEALKALAFNLTGQRMLDSESCVRINIMGNIVRDAAPYLYPFIIEYCLIGAAVVYIMWRHIGYNPRYVTEEDLEQRLEAMLSQRAVAIARAQHGRVDCVGASKGLFFGLLLLVGSLICLILFFVLIRHPELGILAIYLADCSHSIVMVLSILAIIIGFCSNNCCVDSFGYLSCEQQDQDHEQFEMEQRDEDNDTDNELEHLAQHVRHEPFNMVQSLKFKRDEQSDLNDILLRVSAFGLFIYATFSVIAGSLLATKKEPNMLVTVTSALSVLQVVLQLLFIADVSRRRVHLPEHDRSKPGRQIVTFLLICNVAMWVIYTFEMQKVAANPVQLDFYGYLTWALVQRFTLPLCVFHRFHSAVTLAEIWKTSYKARLE